MDLKDLYTIGYIRRTIGVKGETGVLLDVDSPSRYQGIDALILVKNGETTVVELEQARLRGEELVIRIKGTSSPEEAKKFVGSTVMLPLAALPKLNNKQFYFHEIPGYEVIDEEKGLIGKAREVIDRFMQPLLVVDGKNEVMIPLLPETVILVDRERKQLHIKAPAGLIDLYTSEDKSEEEE